MQSSKNYLATASRYQKDLRVEQAYLNKRRERKIVTLKTKSLNLRNPGKSSLIFIFEAYFFSDDSDSESKNPPLKRIKTIDSDDDDDLPVSKTSPELKVDLCQ